VLAAVAVAYRLFSGIALKSARMLPCMCHMCLGDISWYMCTRWPWCDVDLCVLLAWLDCILCGSYTADVMSEELGQLLFEDLDR
jgi:hypothetical protein